MVVDIDMKGRKGERIMYWNKDKWEKEIKLLDRKKLEKED